MGHHHDVRRSDLDRPHCAGTLRHEPVGVGRDRVVLRADDEPRRNRPPGGRSGRLPERVDVDRSLHREHRRSRRPIDVSREALIAGSGMPYSIIRATQFFEFFQRIAQDSTEGDTVRLPDALIQPMAADDVAAAVGRVAVGSRLQSRRFRVSIGCSLR